MELNRIHSAAAAGGGGGGAAAAEPSEITVLKTNINTEPGLLEWYCEQTNRMLNATPTSLLEDIYGVKAVEGLPSGARRGLYERKTPDEQCQAIKTVGICVPGKRCWLCGYKIGVYGTDIPIGTPMTKVIKRGDCVTECEHMLDIGLAILFLSLFNGGEVSILEELEYNWAHMYCNQIKNAGVFIKLVVIGGVPQFVLDRENIYKFAAMLHSGKTAKGEKKKYPDTDYVLRLIKGIPLEKFKEQIYETISVGMSRILSFLNSRERATVSDSTYKLLFLARLANSVDIPDNLKWYKYLEESKPGRVSHPKITGEPPLQFQDLPMFVNYMYSELGKIIGQKRKNDYTAVNLLTLTNLDPIIYKILRDPAITILFEKLFQDYMHNTTAIFNFHNNKTNEPVDIRIKYIKNDLKKLKMIMLHEFIKQVIGILPASSDIRGQLSRVWGEMLVIDETFKRMLTSHTHRYDPSAFTRIYGAKPLNIDTWNPSAIVLTEKPTEEDNVAVQKEAKLDELLAKSVWNQIVAGKYSPARNNSATSTNATRNRPRHNRKGFNASRGRAAAGGAGEEEGKMDGMEEEDEDENEDDYNLIDPKGISNAETHVAMTLAHMLPYTGASANAPSGGGAAKHSSALASLLGATATNYGRISGVAGGGAGMKLGGGARPKRRKSSRKLRIKKRKTIRKRSNK